MKTKYYLINNNYQAIIQTSKDNDSICIGGLNKICFTVFIEKKLIMPIYKRFNMINIVF